MTSSGRGAVILSQLYTTVIFIVLALYDDREPPVWPLGITLNVFLAFFTSMAKVWLMIPVVQGLGQLRWIWFSKMPRRLADFELFESACRSSFGSLRLLFSFKGGYESRPIAKNKSFRVVS